MCIRFIFFNFKIKLEFGNEWSGVSEWVDVDVGVVWVGVGGVVRTIVEDPLKLQNF